MLIRVLFASNTRNLGHPNFECRVGHDTRYFIGGRLILASVDRCARQPHDRGRRQLSHQPALPLFHKLHSRGALTTLHEYNTINSHYTDRHPPRDRQSGIGQSVITTRCFFCACRRAAIDQSGFGPSFSVRRTIRLRTGVSLTLHDSASLSIGGCPRVSIFICIGLYSSVCIRLVSVGIGVSLCNCIRRRARRRAATETMKTRASIQRRGALHPDAAHA